jgi:hypothetical protein
MESRAGLLVAGLQGQQDTGMESRAGLLVAALQGHGDDGVNPQLLSWAALRLGFKLIS